MNKKVIFFGGLLVVFGLLLWIATSSDSKRALDQAQADVDKCDQELKQFEDRYLVNLQALGVAESEYSTELSNYKSAPSRDKRLESFNQIVARTGASVAQKVSADNTVTRRFGDELNGAFNRHQVATKNCAQFVERLQQLAK